MATKSGVLTAKGLAAMAAGEWAADPAARGAGRLQARKLEGGQVAWYYRYTTSTGTRDRLPMGTGLSLAEARQRAGELARRYQGGDKDLRVSIDAAQRDAADEERARAARSAASLRALMTAYVGALKSAGKVSAGNVDKAVRLHLFKAWPDLSDKPADDVTLDDLLPVLARLVAAKKRREASKMRSYLRAAYAAAIRARQDPTAADDLRELSITTNPARDLATIDGSSNTRDRVLSVAELRAYWKRIEGREGSGGAILRFHLLTGGQRISQLARLEVSDFDADAKSVRLLDGKGRRKRPRIHVVPLIKPALAALAELRGRELGNFLFSLNEGTSQATYDDFRKRLDEVVAEMAEHEELDGGSPFLPGDVRRTVETRLAAIGTSDEARGHLQSHGLGGVQNRHYNRHHYDIEKRAALDALYQLLVGKPAKVTNIRRGPRTAARIAG